MKKAIVRVKAAAINKFAYLACKHRIAIVEKAVDRV